MNRLTSFRSFNSLDKPAAPANLGAYVKRNIKTSTPVSHSFGRGYGLVPAKPLGTQFLLPEKDSSIVLIRDMSVGTKSKTKAEKEIEAENLSPKNLKLKPGKENLDDIARDLIKLTEKEIQTILEEDGSSIQTERGKTWLEQSQYSLRPVPDNKDLLVLTKKTGNTTVAVTFKKEYEEVDENEEDEEEYEEGTQTEAKEDTEAEIVKDEENEGQDWVRSGDELPGREDFPQKHSLEIDIRIQDKQGVPKGKLHMYAFAGLDDRLYVNEMLCENDVSVQTEEKKSYCVFDDLSDAMQDRIYDYLDELGVDDRMAHFIKTTVAREKKESDIAFLTNFKEILKN